MWNIKTVENLSSQQKVIACSALELLKEGGEMIYSTCTHSPEENEEVVDFLLKKYDIEILDTRSILPLKTREGIVEWKGKKFSNELKKCARIYPQDNDTEGFFLCKIRKISDNSKDKVQEFEEFE
jgi:16S rRNA C967 or C1407 C5-methylase (RsmB/RsmF family)